MVHHAKPFKTKGTAGGRWSTDPGRRAGSGLDLGKYWQRLVLRACEEVDDTTWLKDVVAVQHFRGAVLAALAVNGGAPGAISESSRGRSGYAVTSSGLGEIYWAGRSAPLKFLGEILGEDHYRFMRRNATETRDVIRSLYQRAARPRVFPNAADFASSMTVAAIHRKLPFHPEWAFPGSEAITDLDVVELRELRAGKAAFWKSAGKYMVRNQPRQSVYFDQDFPCDLVAMPDVKYVGEPVSPVTEGPVPVEAYTGPVREVDARRAAADFGAGVYRDSLREPQPAWAKQEDFGADKVDDLSLYASLTETEAEPYAAETLAAVRAGELSPTLGFFRMVELYSQAAAQNKVLRTRLVMENPPPLVDRPRRVKESGYPAGPRDRPGLPKDFNIFDLYIGGPRVEFAEPAEEHGAHPVASGSGPQRVEVESGGDDDFDIYAAMGPATEDERLALVEQSLAKLRVAEPSQDT